MGGVQLKGAQVTQTGPSGPAQAAAKPAAAPAQKQAQVDWKLECGHHAKDASRPLFVHGNRLEIVADKGKPFDKVTIHYKNEQTAPPASLQIGGTTCNKGPKQGQFDTYAFDAKFLGNNEQKFWTLGFWKNWRQGTIYRVENAPLPFEIQVRSPRRYKLEFAFPAMKGWKGGEKYTKDKTDGALKLEPKKLEKTYEASGWSPTNFKTRKRSETENRQYTSTGYRSTFKVEDTTRDKDGGERELPPIAFAIDDHEVKLDLLEAIGKFKELVDSFQKIVKSFKEKAPQVGWYFEYELQLFQGTLAVEWNWQEAHDHTAFTYVDLCVAMTLVSASIEGGVGIAGLGFRAQLYILVNGSLDLKVSGRRERPEMNPGFAFPLTLGLAATLGVRFEVGNFIKATGTGTSGFEFKGEMGINRPDRQAMLTFDLTGEWTGIKITVAASAGFYGIGPKTKFYEKKLADPRQMFEIQWPSDKKYEPPEVSRDRIRQVVLEHLTKGFFDRLKVATTVSNWWLNDYMDIEKVTDRLMEVIDKNPGFDRSPDVVDGLGSGIRGDLRAIAENNKHDYVTVPEFEAYLTGADALPKRLKNMVPPSNALVAPKPAAPPAPAPKPKPAA